MADNTTPTATDYSGVREYVGARYVPVFANPAEWDNQRGYEPLTIVLHEGNSFTSTQYVPTGIDINNTQYWQETGNWNAQIEAYRKEVLAYDERITNNASNINQVKSDLATTNNSINAIYGEINTIQTTISKIRYFDNLLIIGDSWSDKSFQSGISGRWVDYLQTYCKFNNVYNYSESGAGFSHINANGRNFNGLVTKAADLAENIRNSISHIIVFGSVNDINDSNVSYAGIISDTNALILNAINNFPNAEIHIVAPCTNAEQYTNLKYYQIKEAIVHSCMLNGYGRMASYHDATGWLWQEGTLVGSNSHPNLDGNMAIAAQMYNILTGGEYGITGFMRMFPASGLTFSVTNFSIRKSCIEMPFWSITGLESGTTISAGTVSSSLSFNGLNIPIIATTNNGNAARVYFQNSGNIQIIKPSNDNAVYITPMLIPIV